MPYTITFNPSCNRLEGKLSEFCKRSPFIPVEVTIVPLEVTLEDCPKAVVFSQKERVRNCYSELLYVTYEGPQGQLLRIVNDI